MKERVTDIYHSSDNKYQYHQFALVKLCDYRTCDRSHRERYAKEQTRQQSHDEGACP